MDHIDFSDISKYQYNKNLQVFGVLLGALLPVCMAVDFFKANDDAMPKILDNEQATTICLQESFDKTSLTNEGFHINLSRPQINACAASKITQSKEIQSAYIKDREDNAWKPYAVSGVFTLVSLAVAGYGFSANRRLRKEKPGIEEKTPHSPFMSKPHL